MIHGGKSLKLVEYFISLRPSWLCCCLGRSVGLEWYQPNRVARQFGYSQATAYDGRPFILGIVDARQMESVPMETQLYAASMMWAYLLRLSTNSQFHLASYDNQTGISYTHLTWVRLSFAPFSRMWYSQI